MSEGPRRYGAALVIVGVVVASLTGGAVRAGSAATPRASVDLSAQVLAARVVPGGSAPLLVTVSNTGRVATRAGVQLTVTAPASFRFLAVTDVAHLPGLDSFRHPAGEHWRCTATSGGHVALCQEPAGLAPGQSVAALIRFAAPADLRSRGSPSFVVSASGAASVTKRAPMRLASGQPSPSIFVDTRGTSTVRADQTAVEQVTVVNVGSGPATSVKLANLLPPAVVGTWSAGGRGWTCAGASGTPPTCTYSGAVGVDTVAPRLTISYRLDPARVAALNLPVGGAPSVQTWEIGVTSGGGAGQTTTSPAFVAVGAPPGALIVTTAVAGRGGQELLPGTTTSIHVKLANIGNGATKQLALLVSVPAGMSITAASGGFSCTPETAEPRNVTCLAPPGTSIAPRRSLAVELTLAAATGAAPVDSAVTIAATSENQVAGEKTRATSLPIVILRNGTGFPALTLLRAVGSSSLQPVLDGSPASVLAGGAFTERLDVRDAGSAPIAAGSKAELTQSLGPGANARLLSEPAGWSCSTRARVSCTVTFPADVLPAASLDGPTIVVTAATATKGEVNWPATIRLAGADAPKASRLPVLVSVQHTTIRLVPNFTADRVPTAGGTGRYTLTVHNAGDGASVDPVRLGLHLPAGVRLEQLTTSSEWRCETTRTSARCISARPAAAGARLAHIDLALSFGAGTAGRALTLVARAADGARPAQSDAIARMAVVPRGALRAVITEPDRVAFADQPLISSTEKVKPTTIVLRGDGSGGSGMGLHYRWTSVTAPVTWLGQPVGTAHPTTADVEFQAPQVTKPTTLVFSLSVTDGSATASTKVRLKVYPLPSATKGFNFDKAHPHKEKQVAPGHERRRLPKPADPLKPSKTPPPPKKDSATPTDTNPTTTSETTTSATTTAETTTTTTTTTSPSASLPPIFCELVDKALAAGGSFSASLPGGVDLHLSDVKVHGSACDSGTTVTFEGSGFSLDSYLSASGVSGTISAGGISLDSGTIAAPAAWNTAAFKISSLTIAYGSDVSVEGKVTADSFGLVPLPAGWSGTTSLEFSSSGSGTSVTFAAGVTGPKSDASPDSPAPTASVDGTVSSNGTFDLSFSIQKLVQLAGSSVSVSGHVVRSEPGGAITTELEGSLDQPIQIVPGLFIQTLTVHAKPTSDSLGLTANGTIRMAAGSNTVDVNVKLTYDNPKNWSLTAESSGDATWTPVPGLTIAASDFSGAIVAKDDAYQLTLHVALSHDWKPNDRVTVSGLELTLSNTCIEGGGPCPKDASLFLEAKGNVSFNLPSIGTVTAKLAGSLALPTGEFSVSADLASPVSIGAGIQITNASVAIEHGVTPNPEDPSAETADAGGFRVDLSGAISVPHIGQLPTVHASFSDQGWAIAVPMGGFSLPGASGDGSQVASAVLGWASYATSMNVYDAATKQVTKISIPAGGFKLTGSFTTPAWLRQTLGLPGDVTARATGTFDPAKDTYALRMDFGVPGQPYLYGSASSATNIKLTSVFFQIESKAGDFNLALGGSAQLNVAATPSLPASSADLTVEVSYIVNSQTVSGTLNLSSPNGWHNAFGTQDLTLYGLALQFSFNIPTLTPGIGFGATATLPPTMQQQLGMLNSAKTTVVANISVDHPCVGFQVTDPTNTGQTVLNLGNGALTATQFEFDIAPFGCKVGDYSYAPGLSLQFNGAVAGVPVQILASVTISPFAFDGKVKIGQFAVGGLTVKETNIEVALGASKLKVTFSGGVEVFGTNVDISGGVVKGTTGTTADFKGSLDQLSLGGGAVTAKNLKVTVHIETGAKNVLQFAASGDVQVLGATATGTFSLSLADGQLNAAHADLRAAVNFGGGTGVSLNGTFKCDYAKGQPFTLDGNVKVKVGVAGDTQFDGTVSLQTGYVQVGVKVSVGTLFSADVSGAVYYGAVPKGATIPTASGNVAAKTGDFYLSAKDVTLNMAGFKAVGSVAFGKAGGTPFGSISASLQLTGSSSNNSVTVAGSFNGTNDITLTGSANLTLTSFTTNVTVTFRKTPNVVKLSGSASLSVLGSSIAVNGDFAYANGLYQFRLTGTGSLVVGGYNLANAFVKFSNFPEDAGLKATVTVSVGGVVSARGDIDIQPGGRFALSANANVDLKVLTANMNVSLRNYGQICFPKFSFSGFNISWSQSCTTFDSAPTLSANGSVTVAGVGFGLSVSVSSNGAWSGSARTPVSGESTWQSGTVDLGVVKGYALFSYHFGLGASSANAPVYLSVDAAGNAEIKYQYWFFGWSDWKTLFGIGISIRTQPFQACGSTTIAGHDFSACVP